MADEKGKAKNKEAGLKVDGDKKKKIIIIIIVIVLAILVGGGYYFFAGANNDESSKSIDPEMSTPTSNQSDAANSSVAQVGTALYVPMPRPFRFNIPGAERDRFVEIRVQLLVRGIENEENTKMNIPLIENSLLNVFSQANADDLITSVGKEALKQQALGAVQLVMKELKGDETIEQVLFTGFVMQ